MLHSSIQYSDAGKEREEEGKEGKDTAYLGEPLLLATQPMTSLLSFKTIKKENFLQRLSRDLLTPSSN